MNNNLRYRIERSEFNLPDDPTEPFCSVKESSGIDGSYPEGSDHPILNLITVIGETVMQFSTYNTVHWTDVYYSLMDLKKLFEEKTDCPWYFQYLQNIEFLKDFETCFGENKTTISEQTTVSYFHNACRTNVFHFEKLLKEMKLIQSILNDPINAIKLLNSNITDSHIETNDMFEFISLLHFSNTKTDISIAIEAIKKMIEEIYLYISSQYVKGTTLEQKTFLLKEKYLDLTKKYNNFVYNFNFHMSKSWNCSMFIFKLFYSFNHSFIDLLQTKIIKKNRQVKFIIKGLPSLIVLIQECYGEFKHIDKIYADKDKSIDYHYTPPQSEIKDDKYYVVQNYDYLEKNDYTLTILDMVKSIKDHDQRIFEYNRYDGKRYYALPAMSHIVFNDTKLQQHDVKPYLVNLSTIYQDSNCSLFCSLFKFNEYGIDDRCILAISIKYRNTINTSDLRNYKRLVYLLVSIYFISNKIN
jgi:hypothetical protein